MHNNLKVTVAMFLRMGLNTNLEKTKYMVCTPSFILCKCIEKAYKRRIMGKGEMFIQRKRTRLSCTKCGTTVAALYLKYHMEQLHRIYIPHTRGVKDGGGGPTTCVVSSPRVLKSAECTLTVCLTVGNSA